ncbi:MAG: hypothetical protein IT394_02420 [Candidatus Omnitrophica bacterium]|nr:hypothetical protein [bacterium]MBK7494982.1 hypothetical protein [Candidatus Omnitrophota bacterium]MBV6480430.1 hypothetical protein [bacterium]MCC6732061.1 hypothetical protein [Candidatus Omnitrophota bacterium]
MVRFLISLLVIIAAATGSFFILMSLPAPPEPVVNMKPEGISQSTVSEVRIPRKDLLAQDKSRVWVQARVGNDIPKDAAILVDLRSNESICLVTGAHPLGWLNSDSVLFYWEGSLDPIWIRLFRKFGAQIQRHHVTRFFRVDLSTGKVSVLADLETDSAMMFSSLSPDARWLVATWGPMQAYEISLQDGKVTPRIDEKYVWAPCFVDNGQYFFVGETSLQSRTPGTSSSERASQPLLQEIRDAIKLKGTPSIEVCGRIQGQVYSIDHVPDGRFDRLLVLDERTRIMKEITQLEPSRTLPDFRSDGSAVVYQGNPYTRTQDTVFLQQVAEGSTPGVLVEGISGQGYADPLFIGGDRVLFVHRGTELRSIPAEGGEHTLHWPQSLLP